MKSSRNTAPRRSPRDPVDQHPKLDDVHATADGTDDNEDADEPNDWDEAELPQLDDANWEAFIADDDERDPLPEYGDFWIEDA